MAEAGEQITIIAGDTEIKGEMRFEKSARIVGKFEGTISGKGELHVADGSLCKADIDAATVTVDGVVEGNISASSKVQLNAKAKVKGDIAAAKLVTAEGASIAGHISVGPDAGKGGAGGGGSSSNQNQPQRGGNPNAQSGKPEPVGAK